MPALSEYSNVYNTAVNILQAKGYRVWYQEESALFWAEQNGWDFCSESPCGLLGLIAIFEFQQPPTWREYWWKNAGSVDCYKLPREAPAYTPVYSRRVQ